MNEHIQSLYRECRTKEALASQTEYNSANVLLGSEVEKFAELIVQKCAAMAECFHRNQYDYTGDLELHEFIKQHFGVND